jgi:DNA repair protein RadC
VPEHLPIKNWSVDDRPREKLLQRGVSALTDAELLAILLGSGTKEKSAVDLGRELLTHVGGLLPLARSSVNELTQIKGIGEAKAISLVVAFELSRRKQKTELQNAAFTSAQVVADFVGPMLVDLNREVFHVLFLNTACKLISHKTLFEGGISQSVVDIRLIFKEALLLNSSAIIVCHNHPSGSLEPSNEDLKVTERIRQAGAMLQIPLLDHLILSQSGYFSFKEQGHL